MATLRWQNKAGRDQTKRFGRFGPNTLESMAEPEEQQNSGSAIRADTTEQTVVDGGVPVAAVDEMIKQQVTKHHGNKVKLEQHLARTETNRRATATAKRDHR